MRMTTQRSVILEELRRSKAHPTADEIYTLVKRRLPGLSLSTVYRNLEVLARAGLIQAVELSGAPRRYDGCLEEHLHVRCLECGRVDDVSDDLLERARERVEKLSGYRIMGHNLEFTGRCPGCDKKQTQGKRRKGNAQS